MMSASSQEPRFFIGTSGWTYDHWKGLFYPEHLPKSRWFEYYAMHFPAVEINATFYRTFKDQTYLKWRERAPGGFEYVLKAPKLITHRKYLEGVCEEIQAVWRSACLLEERLGLILLQVAPGTPFDLERLSQALLAFGNPGKIAVEFRRKEWYCQATCELLRELGATFCNVDSPRQRLTDWLTSGNAYLRLHGRKRWYLYDYSEEELEEISGVVHSMVKNGAQKVYAFFNNDFEGYAPKNALRLLEKLKGGV